MEQKKLYEYAADAADGRPIDPEHCDALSGDPGFHAEHGEQAAVKNILERSSLRAPAPAELKRSVIATINALKPSPGPNFIQRFIQSFLNPQPAFAVALVAVIVSVAGIWYFASPTPPKIAITETAEAANIIPASLSDIVHQSANNFTDIKKGTILVQYVSDNKDALLEFFKKNGVTYEVYFSHFLKSKNVKLIGGVVSEYKGAKLAHLVYQRDTTLIYIYQTNIDALSRKDCLTAEKGVTEALLSAKPFIHECSHCNMVVWKEHQTVCSAVSKMPNKELLALLTN